MTLSKAPLSDNAQGALWMMVSMAGFVMNDTFMKSLSGELPLFQAIFLRGLIATGLIALLAWYRGALSTLPRGPDRRLMSYRVIGEIGGTSLFLTALFNMPLANATAIIMSAPLTVTLAAAWFLGHRVGWRRYLAIAIGFAGVMLIVRPGGDGFNIYAVAALASVVFITLRDVSTRGLSAAVPSLQVTVATSLAITLFSGLVVAFSEWEPVRWQILARLIGSALLLLMGYYAGVVAMRVGEIGFVSPFRYSNLLWALLLGFVVFGDVPGWATISGALIVVGTGVYTFHRERIAGRAAIAAAATPATPAPASMAYPDVARPGDAAHPGPR